MLQYHVMALGSDEATLKQCGCFCYKASLTQLQFGAFDAVAHFNICRPASVLVLEKMNFRPGNYLLEGCRQINQKRLHLARNKNTERAKKCRQVIRGKKKKSRFDKTYEKVFKRHQPTYLKN